MKKCHFLSYLGLSVILSGGIVLAQSTTGAISGTVRDTAGAVLPGANVLIVNEGTGLSRTIQTDAEGRYSAPALNLGTYQITGTRDGFRTEVRTGIELTVGREAVVDLTLAVGNVTEKVEVAGDAPLVETTTASLGSLVEGRMIRELPLNGRSFDQLALLQPGVALTDPDETQSASSFIYGTGKRFSVGGQRSNSNSFLLDGTNISDEGNGTPGGAAGTNLGVDAIQEFKIFTNSFKAEYGRDSGSVTTAVTRSGTNALHGTAFEYIRNSALDARNYFDIGSSPPPFKRNQFGGVLGGPINTDKTFFFIGYEGLRQALGTSMEANVPTVLAKEGILPTGTVSVNPASVPFLSLYPNPNGPDLGGGIGEYLSAPTVITNEDNGIGRLDRKLNDKTSIFARYSFDHDTVNSPLSIPPQVLELEGRRQYTTLQANSLLSDKALNNFRFAFNRTVNYGNVTGSTDPSVVLVPGQPFGTLSIGNNTGNGGSSANIISQIAGGGKGNGVFQWNYNIFEWGDDFTYVKGKHSFKTGADIQRLEDNNIRTVTERGSLTFATFNTFLAGKPSNFQASYPLGEVPHYAIRQTLLGFYGQDDYTVTSRLTLNLGLRWEVTTDPYDANGTTTLLPSITATSMVPSSSYFSIGKKNFEPRFGLAWQINGSGKTVLRVGAGIYHNQILPWLFPNQTQNPPYYGTLSANNPPFPNPINAFSGLNLNSLAGKIALNVIAPFEKVPTSYQYSLSIQQQVSRNTVVQLSYAGNLSDHDPLLIEADTFTPTVCSTSLNNCPAGLANGQLYYPATSPRLNPAWASIRWGQDAGDGNYNSGTVLVRHESANGLVGQVYYTYSKALDQISNGGASDSLRAPSAIMDPFDRNLDWGLSEFDLKHAAVANFSYPVPLRADSTILGALVNHWTLSGIATFESGLPFTARLASSQSRDGSAVLADRPNLVAGFSTNPTSGVSAGCSGLAAGTPIGNATHWYDPCAFALPIAGTYGNLGRNTLIGPGVIDSDLALEKGFKVLEKATATFRFETFNFLNHTNFGLPNTVALTSTGAASPTAGQITYTTTSSRQLQFALRISF